MSLRKDLTRWNRAGLSRFRYVDGNAVDYLEILRQQLVEKFKDPQTDRCEWLDPALQVPGDERAAEAETLIQRQVRLNKIRQRLLESYHQGRRDWAWEISRTFARACHILTEHVDAYANEGYLGTATQWEHVRRLVEMLDYHPAPPASAFTRLAFIAKGNKAGLVPKGFQVKHSPPDGGPKVVFETLEDLLVDPALNELRPKGWDQSDEPPLQADSNGTSQLPAEEQKYSSIANGPAINLQGVGQVSASKLNTLAVADGDVFRIRDFLYLDPDNSGLGIDPTWLWEWKAKADILINFTLKGDWSSIAEWLLSDIAAASADALAILSGNSLEMAGSLKQDIEIIDICLDRPVFLLTHFEDLIAPAADVAGRVVTFWHAQRKPKVVPGQVAMVFREFVDENTGKAVDEAEAATVASIEKQTKIIHLTPSPVQKTWFTWKKNETLLKVAPRWKRKCWLNNKNKDVIRTVRSHGLSAESYICWMRALVGYDLHLSSVGDLDDLMVSGRSLVIVGRIKDHLHVRIFDSVGEKVIDKTEEELFIGDALTALQAIDFSLYDSGVSAAKKQEIKEIVASCAGYKWRYAKVIEVDRRNLRLETTGPLPKKGTEIFLARPLEGPNLPSDIEDEVGLKTGESLSAADIDKFTPKDLVDEKEPPVFPSVESSEEPPPDPLLSLIPSLFGELPEVGNFIIPTPMLPMDIVKAAVKMLLKIGAMVIPSTGEPVFEFIEPLELADEIYGLLDGSNVRWVEDEPTVKSNIIQLLTQENGPISLLTDQDELVLFKKIAEEILKKGPFLIIPKKPPVQAVIESSDPLYMFDGKPGKIDVGDWVIAHFTDGMLALKVSAINEFIDDDHSETFSFSFEKGDRNKELKKVYGDFRGELLAEGATINTTQLDSEGIELEDLPETLSIGHDVLLTAVDRAPVAAKIDSIDGNTIKTMPPATDFTKGNLIIFGNTVLAGHGQSKPAKILGSGNAARSNQEFTLEIDDLSFTPDATKRSGVAAAMDVEVDGRTWAQVSSLKDSAPEDHHYVVRMTENGHVKIIFGDGTHGRRLPSGKNNIRVRYRVGSGLGGNLPEGSLVKPVNPHPLVKSVLQPLPSAGGGEMEDVATLRDNAPATLLALERAVSLSDFSHLAASQSSVWQARAHRQIVHGGKTQSVKVVIVPADGVRSTSINEAVRSFLQKHALPGVQVVVESFDPQLFDLRVTVRVRTDAFIADTVVKAVASALSAHFGLKRRKLGQPLYLSEVYRVVEGIRGVENSLCVLNENSNCQVIEPEDERTVIYLDTADKQTPSTLLVNAEEYRP